MFILGKVAKKNPEKVWSFAIDGIIGIDISPSFASLLNWSNDGNDASFQSDKIEWKSLLESDQINVRRGKRVQFESHCNEHIFQD